MNDKFTFITLQYTQKTKQRFSYVVKSFSLECKKLKELLFITQMRSTLKKYTFFTSDSS